MSRKNSRKGSAARSTLIGLLVIAVLGTGAFFGWKLFAGGEKSETPPQMVAVKKDTFVHEILERGNVESAENVDVLCDVESNNGVTIIWVIPEGTEVKKGDPIIEFDSSTFTESVNKQEIQVLTSAAKVAQSKVDLENAMLDLEEYEEGKFIEAKKTAQNKILQAKEDMRQAEDQLKFNSTLFARGYVTESTVEKDEFAFEKAKNALEVAEIELKNLIEYTYKKTVNSYRAKIEAAETKLKTDEVSHKLEEERLAHLKKQLEKCKVDAPQDGQVVYTPPPRWGSESDIIREGKKVYERQEIIKLPNPAKMQVKGLVNEASIRLVKVGHPAVIELEAFPNQFFRGVVKTVNDYPEPTGWGATNMAREYQTTITILDPPSTIKPGLTAKVKIIVNVIEEALMLPIQAVFEHGDKKYCVVYDKGNWDKIEVQTGPTNDKFVVIESGLSLGAEVVLNSWQNREKLNLPKIDKEERSGPLDGEFPREEDSPSSAGPSGAANAERGPQPGGVREGGPPGGDRPRRERGGEGAGAGEQPGTPTEEPKESSSATATESQPSEGSGTGTDSPVVSEPEP